MTPLALSNISVLVHSRKLMTEPITYIIVEKPDAFMMNVKPMGTV